MVTPPLPFSIERKMMMPRCKIKEGLNERDPTRKRAAKNTVQEISGEKERKDHASGFGWLDKPNIFPRVLLLSYFLLVLFSDSLSNGGVAYLEWEKNKDELIFMVGNIWYIFLGSRILEMG